MRDMYWNDSGTNVDTWVTGCIKKQTAKAAQVSRSTLISVCLKRKFFQNKIKPVFSLLISWPSYLGDSHQNWWLHHEMELRQQLPCCTEHTGWQSVTLVGAGCPNAPQKPVQKCSLCYSLLLGCSNPHSQTQDHHLPRHNWHLWKCWRFRIERNK